MPSLEQISYTCCNIVVFHSAYLYIEKPNHFTAGQLDCGIVLYTWSSTKPQEFCQIMTSKPHRKNGSGYMV